MTYPHRWYATPTGLSAARITRAARRKGTLEMVLVKQVGAAGEEVVGDGGSRGARPRRCGALPRRGGGWSRALGPRRK